MRKHRMDDGSDWKKFTDGEIRGMNCQFEKDSKIHDFSDSDMDRIFQESLDDVVKNSRKKKIYKYVGMAASVVIVLSAMLNCFTQVAYGESLFDIVKNSIQNEEFLRTFIGANNTKEQKFEQLDDFSLWYEADSIDDLFTQITQDKNNDELDVVFIVENLPTIYNKFFARYDKEFQTLVINSKNQNNYLYILEELNYESMVSGVILQPETVSTVFNENLQINIDIVAQMDTIRNQGYYIEIFYDNKRLRIEGNGTLEEFETIAKNISLLEEDFK